MAKLVSPEWVAFLSKVEKAKKELGIDGTTECFYRGHSKSTYDLRPGLFRNLALGVKEITDEVWEAESDVYFEFRSRAKAVHGGDISEWDVLFHMQHHGVRTRLLDWTENLGVAIYFALGSNMNAESPTIWMLNPYRLNIYFHNTKDLFAPEYLGYYDADEEEDDEDEEDEEEEDEEEEDDEEEEEDDDEEDEEDEYDDEPWLYTGYLNRSYDLWWEEPIAIYPVRKVERLATQGGYFTIHGSDTRALEKIAPRRNDFLRKIPIPKKAVRAAKDFLAYAGINEFSIFPDLDGLARFLNRKYF